MIVDISTYKSRKIHMLVWLLVLFLLVSILYVIYTISLTNNVKERDDNEHYTFKI